MARPLRPELEPLLEEARRALEAEEPALALERAERGEGASHKGDLAELAADFALVAAAALNQLGRSSEALDAAERVLKDWPDDPDAMLERGVAVRPIGTAIAFCPPLVITDEQIDTCVDVLAEAVNAQG